MQTINEQFNSKYQIEKMNKASLTLVNKRTGEHLFISRNAYNAILQNKAEGFEERKISRFTEFGGEIEHTWLSVNIWITF